MLINYKYNQNLNQLIDRSLIGQRSIKAKINKECLLKPLNVHIK